MEKKPKLQKLKGKIQLIIGCMYAGKTEAFIRRVNRLEYAGYKVQIFKPQFDVRYAKDHVVAHSKIKIKCQAVVDSSDLQAKVERSTDVIAIDELQFFDDNIVNVINAFANNNYLVIANGLDKDFRGVPFQNVINCMAYAENITKLNAVCLICGNDADRTQRLYDGIEPASYDEPVMLQEPLPHNNKVIMYEARCRHHHIVPGYPTKV